MDVWTPEKAQQWYEQQPWLVGCNFINSTAINQLEMWQAETFDEATLDRELGWAAGLGMNVIRVYLHNLAWQADPEGFKARVDRFLQLASSHGIRVILVLLDDCWNDNPKVGTQPEPIPGVHNSGWLRSPATAVVNAPEAWPSVRQYVRDTVARFAADERVLMWDLYNEPGNSGQNERSLPLLCKTFEWAREARPTQPLTAGVWYNNAPLNAFQLAASDVITFHNYNDAASLAGQIADLRRHGRPLVCTEWMRRGASDVAACLPVFQRERVGCLNWGLVAGKTQTIFPWGAKPGGPEPAVWFHDLLRRDGTPFDPAETALFRALTGRGAAGR